LGEKITLTIAAAERRQLTIMFCDAVGSTQAADLPASRRVGDDNRIWRIKRLQSHRKIGSFGGAAPRRSDPDDEAGDDAEPHFQPLWQIEAADRIDDNEAVAYGLLAICCNALERLRLSSRRSSQIPPLQQESLTRGRRPKLRFECIYKSPVRSRSESIKTPKEHLRKFAAPLN
jgi:hypothetical protein